MMPALLLHVVLGGNSIWREWNADPGILLPLGLSAGWYLRGFQALRRARGNRSGAASRARTRQAVAFGAGWLVLFLSLLSPLHALSEQLFSAHMVQHELLMTVAAPLLVLSRPAAVCAWALPAGWRKPVAGILHAPLIAAARRTFSHPATGWLVYATTLWLWHAPALFQAAVRSNEIHALQHGCFFAASIMFWHSLRLHRSGTQGGTAILYLFTTAVHTSILGALITFDTELWYPAYTRATVALGVAPLHDQQWAGLIMWVPGSIPYLLAALLAIVQWLRASGQQGWKAPVALSASQG